jgi:Tfp pilus assembly protein PilV
MNTKISQNQKGFTLTEALVAFAVVAIGLLGIVSFQVGLFSGSSYSKARTEAMTLAQQKIEQLKHYTHASEDNFIDENNDDIMDADGAYAENPINGQNAVFTRSWEITTNNETKQIDVTVSWPDATDATQSVILTTGISWISPRSGADRLTELEDPIIDSPTGRAKLGEGNLADYSPSDYTAQGLPGADGLQIYQHNRDLLLVDSNDDVLLTLIEACTSNSGTCIDFVRISGTVYVDTANTRQSLEDIFVIASDAALCQRSVPSGTLSNPPTTANGDYEYYNYTCYLGGGWHGNIGFVTESGVSQNDKVCQGDPTALDVWDQPVIALRRAYRGMIQKDSAGQTIYLTQGIKDAAALSGHDYVFTKLSISQTEGTYCTGLNGPMTRSDSANGARFQGVPTDFFCLNTDIDGDLIPDYLDSFDTSEYSADPSCPYDPTDPPILAHEIRGTVTVSNAGILDLSSFTIVTSDGPGNCSWVSPFARTGSDMAADYMCDVFDWGNGWSGFVQVRPNSNDIYCPSDTTNFAAITSDQAQDFGCLVGSSVLIEGPISLHSARASISSIVMTDLNTGVQGSCTFSDTEYQCKAPYTGTSWDGTIEVSSNKTVCGSAAGVFTFLSYTSDSSPYTQLIATANSAAACP